MSTTKPISAKIIQHSEGLGAPDAETVRKRAQELAIINGREQFSEDDWREAKRELHGGHELNDTNGEFEMASLVSEHDMIATSVGHHTENIPLDDATNVAEELIAEGMDEAVHEQMLASRREEALGDDSEDDE